jgi:hypothetical protein
MLDSYCRSISNEAQLKIAIRLGKLAFPVWSTYFTNNPAEMDKINELIKEGIQVNGGGKIDINFPLRALEKIERSLVAAQEKSVMSPIPLMKSDATLSPLLATCMQPLTNKEWDNILPKPVKLVFTAVFNILVWILYRRRNAQLETHIYVAINQVADVLLHESKFPVEDIDRILYEYKHEVNRDTEESEWENARPVGRSEPLDQEDIYRKIIGEKVTKDQPGRALAIEVLRQMREEGKSYWNMMDEYLTGTSTTYSYEKEKGYNRHEFDAIVGSFSNNYPMTENEMLEFVSQLAVSDLRESGFEV